MEADGAFLQAMAGSADASYGLKGLVLSRRGWCDMETGEEKREQNGDCNRGVVWYGMVWYGMFWYGMVWYGMVWCGVVWCGVV